MTKNEIAKSLASANGGAQMVNINQIAAWTGMSRDWVRTHILTSVDHVASGKDKLFYVGDVADAMIAMKGAR